MLNLILFRHGKSDWDLPSGNDHERPLAARGKDAARCMGRLLQQTREVPELAISSSALRARDTLRLAARAGKWKCPQRIESTLYQSSPHAVLAWLQALDGTPASVLLTGHEPTWSELASRLIGRALLRVPTAAMLRIDFEADTWRQVEFGQGELRWLLPPKVVCRVKGVK
jgi:phosphohistidine phosphatase